MTLSQLYQNFTKIALILVIITSLAATAPINDEKTQNKESKSAFGPAFDEIVVESSLTVRRKTPDNNNINRQSRAQNLTEATTAIKTKREVLRPRQLRGSGHNNKGFGGSAADSQAQSFNSFGPLGNFGASATGAQTQSFGFGPNGFAGSAGFSGTQQYNFNGQTVDIAFGNAVSGAGNGNAKAGGAAITITGPDGKKRPFSG